MRKPLLIAAGVLAVLVAGLAAALLLVDVNQFRPFIQTRLQKQFRRDVEFGNLKLNLFPLAIRIDNAKVAERPGWPSASRAPFLQVQTIDVKAELFPLLLKREVHINSVVLRQPRIELSKDAAGKWNYADLTEQDPSSKSDPIDLAELTIEDGSFAISSPKSPRSVIEHVNVRLRDFAPGKPVSLEASLQLPGSSSADSFKVSGTAGSNVDLQLALKDAPLAGLAALGGSASMPVSGMLNGSATIKSAGTATAIGGKLELSKASYEKKPLPFPATLEFALNSAANTLRVETLKLTGGQLAITGGGQMNTEASTVDLRLKMADTGLGDLMALASVFGDVPMKAEGRVTLDAVVRGPMAAPAYSGTGTLREAQLTLPSLKAPLAIKRANLQFDRATTAITGLEASLAGSNAKGAASLHGSELDFDLDLDQLDTAKLQQVMAPAPAGGSAAASSGKSGGPAMRAKGNLRVGTLIAEGLRFTQVKSECTWAKEVLTLAPITAQLFGGTHAGRLVIDTNQNPPALETSLKLVNVDANQLLSATTSIKQLIFGLVEVSGDSRMKLASDSTAMARSLNGGIQLRLQKGKIAGVNILNQLSTVARFAGYNAPQSNITEILQLDGDVNIDNGVAKSNNLRLSIPGAVLSLDGTVNLADQNLNMKLLAVLDKDLSQKAGGTGIGGFLQAALANPQGQLVIPAILNGTMGAPRFLPDAARMAQMKLQQGPTAVKGLIDMFRKK